MAEPENTILRYQEVESTNTMALELGNQGAANGTIVVAAQQSGGKGRKSRSFCSPPGGLYMSIVIRPKLDSSRLALVTLAAGVAAAEAIEAIAAGAVAVQLKWPNDLYLAGRKLGGIITETGPYSHRAGEFPFVVIGLGINVNSSVKTFPPDLRDRATSLYDVLQRHFDIDRLLVEAAQRLLNAAGELRTNPASVLAQWRSRDYLLGRQVRWHDHDGRVVTGTGSGLLGDGLYRIAAVDGRQHAVIAGDIVVLGGGD